MAEEVQLDRYRNAIINNQQAVDLTLAGRDLDGAFLKSDGEVELFNRHSRRLMEYSAQLFSPPGDDLDPAEYHKELSEVWLIPDKYQQLDPLEHLLPRATHPGGEQRLREEMAMFEERGMIPVLRCIMYLVDLMTEHDVVWGVGRGSSVASYTLYLTGLNRINPLDFDLDIKEFLR